MQRRACDPRPDWRRRVESHGLFYHTLGGETYWDESAHYLFHPDEIDVLERAANTLHEMCLEVVREVIEEKLFGLFLIPKAWEEYVADSWERQDFSLYGRFDLAYDGGTPPRMLEYNADTPTALVEASVAQWFWLTDLDPSGDQFNSIHEHLMDGWRRLYSRDDGPIHFSALSSIVEDYVTVEYLRDTAMQVGFDTDYLDVEQIGFDVHGHRFVDTHERAIRRMFKLYPWEWMLRDEFSVHVQGSNVRWIEPPWKMILSCKSILPLLYDRYPTCPYLLPASFDPLPGDFVRKPIHGREGSNVQVVVDGKIAFETDGPYGDGPFVYQQFSPPRAFDGRYPICGVWVIDDEACGLGMREDDGVITRNTSRFVPHRMTEQTQATGVMTRDKR